MKSYRESAAIWDRGYQGAQEVDLDVEVALPIRCKLGKKLSPEEREINRL